MLELKLRGERNNRLPPPNFRNEPQILMKLITAAREIASRVICDSRETVSTTHWEEGRPMIVIMSPYSSGHC